MRIGRPAEFFLDGSNMNRIYLANRRDMEGNLFHRITSANGIPIPVAYPIAEVALRNMADFSSQRPIRHPVATVKGQPSAPAFGPMQPPQAQSGRFPTPNSPADMGFPVASAANANQMQPNYLVNANASNLASGQATCQAAHNLPGAPLTQEEQLALYNEMKQRQGTKAPKRGRRGPAAKSDNPKRIKANTPSTGMTATAANTLGGAGRGVYANPGLFAPMVPPVYNPYAVSDGFVDRSIGSQMPSPASNAFGLQNAGYQMDLSALNHPLPPSQQQQQANTSEASAPVEEGFEQADNSDQHFSAVVVNVPEQEQSLVVDSAPLQPQENANGNEEYIIPDFSELLAEFEASQRAKEAEDKMADPQN
jgi:hypothetical protein